MDRDRRSIIAGLGLALPFGLPLRASAAPTGPAPVLRLRSFEEAIRSAFPDASHGCHRIPVGHSAAVEAGLQGCVNDRPFAGFPAGGLRIVRCGAEPGTTVGGVRLYVATVDVEAAEVTTSGRPLDFATLPPAPVLQAV